MMFSKKLQRSLILLFTLIVIFILSNAKVYSEQKPLYDCSTDSDCPGDYYCENFMSMDECSPERGESGLGWCASRGAVCAEGREVPAETNEYWCNDEGAGTNFLVSKTCGGEGCPAGAVCVLTGGGGFWSDFYEGPGWCYYTPDCCGKLPTNSDEQGGVCSDVDDCCDEEAQCVVIGGSGGGNCAICAGGFADAYQPDPSKGIEAIPCDPSIGEVCCSTSEPHLTCKAVRSDGGGCAEITFKDENICSSGKLKPDMVCETSEQCDSGKCGYPSGEFTKRCLQPDLTGGDPCDYESDKPGCQCEEPWTCVKDPDTLELICGNALSDCVPAGDPCSKPGESICCNVGDDDYECSDDFLCEDTGEDCYDDVCVNGSDCCDSSKSCQFDTSATPPGWRCLGKTCVAKSTCTSDAECCPYQSPYMRCDPDTKTCRVDPVQGTECEGVGCTTKCPNGMGCDGHGKCEINDECINLQGTDTPDYTTYKNPINNLPALFLSIRMFMYGIAVLIGLAMIIKSGYKYMTSEGDPRKVKEAQEDLTSAIIGIFFIILSVFIMDIIIESIIGYTA